MQQINNQLVSETKIPVGENQQTKTQEAKIYTFPLQENNEDTSFLKTFNEIVYDDFEKKLEEELDLDENIEDDEELNVEDVSIEQTIQDYKTGEKSAFDYIYNHYRPKFERKAYFKRDEDLVQELSIVLMKAIETFDINGGAKFNTYFWKCANNHMGTLNIRRSAKKRTAEYGVISMQESFNTKDSEVEFGAFIKDKNSEQNFDKSDFYIVLKENIYPFLKKNEIQAIEMLLNGYTLDEIGEALGGITAPAVHVKFRRLAEKKNIGKQLKLLYETYCS